MALAQVTNQILRSAGEGTEVVANSPITGNGTSEQPLGIDENWHGQDGESVTFTISAIPSGTRVTLSGAQGTESFDVMNGVDGTNGADGAQGPAGPQGPQGDPGVQGETGPQGIQGERGQAGPQGEQGEQGPAGQDGATGKSAYEIAVEDGFSGNVYEWLESLKGDQGDPGFSPTVSAEAIPSGTRVTITDAVSSTVFDVMNGEQGPSGATGPQGPSGESYTGSLMPLIGDNGIQVTSNAVNAIVSISSVAHDATISGYGTPSSPLGVVGSVTLTQSPAGPVSITDGNVTAYCVNAGLGQGFLYYRGAGLITPIAKEITDITITMNASTLTSVELSSYNSYNKVTVVTPKVYDDGHPRLSSYPLYVDNVKQIDMLSGAYYTFLKGQHDNEVTRWCCGVSGYWNYMPV